MGGPRPERSALLPILQAVGITLVLSGVAMRLFTSGVLFPVDPEITPPAQHSSSAGPSPAPVVPAR